MSFRVFGYACLISTCLLSVAGSALAHHAFSAEFDSASPVTVSGKVTKVEWINPHAWIHVDTQQDDGTLEHWMFEGGTPNALARTGINKRSLPVGTRVIVRGYQSKDKNCQPACKANGRDVALADGRQIFMGSSGTGAPRDGLDPNEG